MKQFRINLTKIEGDGEFSCPDCSTTISPDDCSGLNYDILGVITLATGTVKEIIVKCRGCQSILYLGGFDLLNDLEFYHFLENKEILEIPKEL